MADEDCGHGLDKLALARSLACTSHINSSLSAVAHAEGRVTAWDMSANAVQATLNTGSLDLDLHSRLLSLLLRFVNAFAFVNVFVSERHRNVAVERNGSPSLLLSATVLCLSESLPTRIASFVQVESS